MFGGKPAFGAANTSFGTSSSLFGQNKPATSLFGQPQQQQQQTSSLFGAKPAGTGLFGQSTATNATTGSSLFGSTAANTSSGGLFGQSKPSLFGASTANTSFGQTSTSLFGGSTGATAGTTSMFGASTAAAPNGTTVKFEPVIGSDTMQKNGTNSQISTKHMCITAMKQYESKCIEELRVEDYMAGRKAPAPGTTTTGGLFGSTAATTNTGGGLFGSAAPQQKSIFGSTANATPSFGASTGSTSMFGSPAAATNTGTSLFGAKPAGTGLFGSTATPAASTSLFGSSTAAAAPTTSLFGQPAAATSAFGQPAASTSLFGAPAASATTTPFSFGAPATSTASGFGATSTFGQPAASGATTSLFGAKPATTNAFSFGGGAATTASPFGATAAQPSTGLFGAKPATTGFGTATTGTGLFGTAQPAAQQPGTGLFGAAQPTMGAFGAQQQVAAAPVVQQVAAAPIELVTNVTQAQMEMALINAQLGASPYGDSALFNIKEGRKDTEDKPNPTSVQRQLKFLASKKDTASPLNGGSAPKSMLVSKVLDVSIGATPGNTRSPLTTKDLVYSPSVLPPTLGRGLRSGTPSAAMHNSMMNHSRTERSMMKDSVDASIEASLRGNGANRLLAPQTARTNLKHLDASALNEVFSGVGSASRSALGGAAATARDPDELPRREGSGNVLSPLQGGPADGFHARNATLHARQPPTLNLDVTSETMQGSPVRSAAQKENAAGAAATTSPLAAAAAGATSRSSPRGDRLSIGSVKEVAEAGVRLVQPDYYTIPSIEAMRDMVRDGCVVLPDGLTVGRHTFGTVFWAGRLELSDVTLDEVIVFRNKEVTVYPDETIKPPLGQGFNRPAEITLERVWPVDKQTKEEVKDAVALVNMNWREKLEKTTMRMDADFKDFRPLTGSWVFRVKHFSKYGLPDDESEDESGEAQSMKENLLHDRVQRAKVQLAAAGDASSAAAATAAALPQRTSLRTSATASEDDLMIDEDAATLRRAQLGIQALAGRATAVAAAAGLGGDSSYLASPEAARERATRGGRVTLGLTDSSVVAVDEEDWGMGEDDWRMSAVPDKKIKMETIDQEMYEESNRMRSMLQPRVHPRGRVTGAMTLTKREPQRTFEGHAPDAHSLRVPTKTGVIDDTASHGASSRVGWAAGGLSVHSLLPGSNAVAIGMRTFGHEYSQEYISDMFEHNQQLSAVITRHRSSSNRAKHCEELEQEAPSAPRIKPTQNYAQLIDSFAATATQSGRDKERLVWELCSSLFPAERPDTIWEWDRRERVGEWARKALAIDSSASFKAVAGRGASVWKQLAKGELEEAISAAIDEGQNVLASLLAMFTLDPDETMHDFKRQIDEWARSGMLSKVPLPLAKCYVTMAGLTHLGQVNCLEGLPWQAALGLCGLWYSKRAESLAACVLLVEKEAAAGRARLPPLDVHLELMRVAVDRTRSIERVLDAAIAAASAPNDFHLAWHVWAVTRAVGLPAADECSEHALHTQYAEQLAAAAALPHAALFVLAHIKNAQCRNLAMREMIDRCALTRQPLDHARVIDWCRVPAEWIEWAKYLEAKMEGDVHAQCEHALRAGELQLAHRLYVREVAPDLLVTDQMELLDELAQQFEEAVDRIPAWGTGGQLYTHYIELKGLQNSEEESLEELLRLRDEICFRLKIDDRCTPIQQIAMETMGREMSELGLALKPDTIGVLPLNAKSAPEIVDADLSMMID